jgi:hypothetical protein
VILATVVAYLGIQLTAWIQWILIAIDYIAVLPLAAAGFLFYIIVRSMEGLGG